MSKFTVGVDVGGTNIKLGIVNAAGKIVERSRLETRHLIGHKSELISAVVSAIKSLLSQAKVPLSKVEGVGFGLPGLIDPQRGVVLFLPNIPGWKNVPLRKIINSKLNVPVYLDNDVNVITLAEWQYGAGKGCGDLVCITLGTGVGGGLIFNNALYRGPGFVAGEIGHMPLNEEGPKCNCGGWGCFERYVGNRWLGEEAAAIFQKPGIIFPDIYPAAVRGDKKALEFWSRAGERIGNGLVGVVNLLNPRLIIIGGGVSNNFRFFSPAVKRVIRERAMKVQGKMVQIKRALLGDDAGIIGAHVLVRESRLAK